jgi:ribonuclease P protein component
MLPLKNRLKKKKEFKEVFKKGEPFEEDFLFLKKKKNDSKEIKIGFIVSLKVSKKAVVRNKIKRTLREVVKNKINKTERGYDVVFIARPEIKNKDFQEIKECLEKLLKKANILND